MQVIFESRDPQGAALRDLAVQRLQFVMRRLTWLVPRARLRLSDVNGPRGGVDKRCQVELATDGAGTVVITSVARQWRSAIDSALARAARVLLRLWRRNHPAARTDLKSLPQPAGRRTRQPEITDARVLR